MAVKAIDVSYCQTDVDYGKVKADGINAVIIRAGFGRETSQKDSEFEKHYKNAKSAGLYVGAYWYSYADSVADAKTEAQACLSCINGKEFDLPVYFDMEESFQTKFGRQTLTNMAIAFCDTIKSAGYKAGVYSNANWLSNYLDYNSLKAKYSIWLAQWSSSHSLSCDIWQYADDGYVSGISGRVDMDIIENPDIIGEEEEMIEYGKINNSVWSFKQHLRTLYAFGVINTVVVNDGGFGDGTLKAVKEVQTKAGIDVDGIVGPDTINAVYTLEQKAYKLQTDKINNAKKALA